LDFLVNKIHQINYAYEKLFLMVYSTLSFVSNKHCKQILQEEGKVKHQAKESMVKMEVMNGWVEGNLVSAAASTYRFLTCVPVVERAPEGKMRYIGAASGQRRTRESQRDGGAKDELQRYLLGVKFSSHKLSVICKL
jgi:hypothetical protein